MNTFAFLALALAILVLIGCQSTGPDIPESPSENNHNLEIVGSNVTQEQIGLITKALACLPTPFYKSVTKIHLRDDLEHFKYLYGDQERIAAGHHCLHEDKGKICIRSRYLNFIMIWHEAAHVYTRALENSNSFVYEWVRIAGDVYTNFYKDYYGDPLSDGLLTQYGRKNYLEDVAEWVEECYVYLRVDSQSSTFSPEGGSSSGGQNKNFKTDKRYRKKLACLRKYGFFSEPDYQKLKPLFE